MTQVSIGRVKRDISDLVNRVAYSGERIVLTSRGRPKAALVSLQDYELLQKAAQGQGSRAQWLVEAQKLADRIQQRRNGEVLDVDGLLDADRRDLDAQAEARLRL
ncbi:MAG: hypothetical protein A2W35_13485 [Chloroflexi bacterium RBG_16_57_11]|nr:MAG: hypothetical protein A2W35_13485 [Chloroflexi bacterium RBG_16_57_11]